MKWCLILTDTENLREVATNTLEADAEQGSTLTAQEGPEAVLVTHCMSLRQLLILFEPQISFYVFLICF